MIKIFYFEQKFKKLQPLKMKFMFFFFYCTNGLFHIRYENKKLSLIKYNNSERYQDELHNLLDKTIKSDFKFKETEQATKNEKILISKLSDQKELLINLLCNLCRKDIYQDDNELSCSVSQENKGEKTLHLIISERKLDSLNEESIQYNVCKEIRGKLSELDMKEKDFVFNTLFHSEILLNIVQQVLDKTEIKNLILSFSYQDFLDLIEYQKANSLINNNHLPEIYDQNYFLQKIKILKITAEKLLDFTSKKSQYFRFVEELKVSIKRYVAIEEIISSINRFVKLKKLEILIEQQNTPVFDNYFNDFIDLLLKKRRNLLPLETFIITEKCFNSFAKAESSDLIKTSFKKLIQDNKNEKLIFKSYCQSYKEYMNSTAFIQKIFDVLKVFYYLKFQVQFDLFCYNETYVDGDFLIRKYINLISNEINGFYAKLRSRSFDEWNNYEKTRNFLLFKSFIEMKLPEYKKYYGLEEIIFDNIFITKDEFENFLTFLNRMKELPILRINTKNLSKELSYLEEYFIEKLDKNNNKSDYNYNFIKINDEENNVRFMRIYQYQS